MLYSKGANVYTDAITDSAHGFHNVLRWNGSRLDTLKGLNANGHILSMLETSLGELLVTGSFRDSADTYIGTAVATQHGTNYIARWTGQGWDTLGHSNKRLDKNFPGIIYTMVEDKLGNIYAAGAIPDNLCIPPYRRMLVMKWDGSQWSKLESAISNLNAGGNIYSLACDRQNNIYETGEWPNTDSPMVSKWDGSNWSAVGKMASVPGMGGAYNLITDSKGNLYAAGHLVDGSNGQYVAKWDGKNWSNLGNGYFNGDVSSLAIDNADGLYAAGFFTNTAQKPYVAKIGGKPTATPNVAAEGVVKVYPNPAKDILIIQTSLVNAHLRLADQTGKTLKEQSLTSGREQVSMSDVPAGLYLIIVTDATGNTHYQKLCKQ